MTTRRELEQLAAKHGATIDVQPASGRVNQVILDAPDGKQWQWNGCACAFLYGRAEDDDTTNGRIWAQAYEVAVDVVSMPLEDMDHDYP